MQTTQAAAMIQSSMWSDESQNERRASSVFRSLYMCVATPTQAISAANGPL